MAPFSQTSPPTTLYGSSQFQLITLALLLEIAHFSKMLASTNQSTWQFIYVNYVFGPETKYSFMFLSGYMLSKKKLCFP
jgi:hypothetical protein